MNGLLIEMDNEAHLVCHRDIASTSLFAIFMLFCVWSMKYQKDTKKFIQQEWLFVINLSLIGLMVLRDHKKCHNIPQIILGHYTED